MKNEKKSAKGSKRVYKNVKNLSWETPPPLKCRPLGFPVAYISVGVGSQIAGLGATGGHNWPSAILAYCRWLRLAAAAR